MKLLENKNIILIIIIIVLIYIYYKCSKDNNESFVEVPFEIEYATSKYKILMDKIKNDKMTMNDAKAELTKIFKVADNEIQDAIFNTKGDENRIKAFLSFKNKISKYLEDLVNSTNKDEEIFKQLKDLNSQ